MPRKRSNKSAKKASRKQAKKAEVIEIGDITDAMYTKLTLNAMKNLARKNGVPLSNNKRSQFQLLMQSQKIQNPVAPSIVSDIPVSSSLINQYESKYNQLVEQYNYVQNQLKDAKMQYDRLLDEDKEKYNQLLMDYQNMVDSTQDCQANIASCNALKEQHENDLQYLDLSKSEIKQLKANIEKLNDEIEAQKTLLSQQNVAIAQINDQHAEIPMAPPMNFVVPSADKNPVIIPQAPNIADDIPAYVAKRTDATDNLLSDIRKGKQLKKVADNRDRSNDNDLGQLLNQKLKSRFQQVNQNNDDDDSDDDADEWKVSGYNEKRPKTRRMR